MFRASDTLPLIRDRELRDRYGHLYRTFGLAMIGAPVIAMVLAAKDVRTFWVELAGVWVFAAYWITKSFEIRHTDSERRAVAGELVTAQHTVRDIFKSVDVLPQTPDAPR
jgi:hypothetical protein